MAGGIRRSASGPAPDPGGPLPLSDALRAVLDQSAATLDDGVELLAGALVVEALRPYWRSDRSATEAHAALRRADAELADVVEAIAPVLLARLECREESVRAVAAVEHLLRHRE